MMCNVKSETLDEVSDSLFEYAINRNEIKFILDNLPESAQNNRNVMEYEFQLLKILSVGWAISFFMFDRSEKKFILETFWGKIQVFSTQLSSTASLVSGDSIDFFDLLKQRTDTYVKCLNSNSEESDPVVFIGPKFAEMCSLENDPCAILAGSKLFRLTLDTVQKYLDLV